MHSFVIYHSIEENQIDVHKFWASLLIWHNRPHVINRSLLGAKVIFALEIKTGCSIDQFLDNTMKYNFSTEDFNTENDTRKCLLNAGFECVLTRNNELLDGCQYIEVKKLFPKNRNIYTPIYQLCFIDKYQSVIVFYDIRNLNKLYSHTSPYAIRYSDNNVQLLIPSNSNNDTSYKWIAHKVLDKIVQWAKESNTTNHSDKNIIRSLSLIPIDEYSQLYSNLKDKYGKYFIEIWPESTDAIKFVYEDIAIATYLCLLWKNIPQRFVDFGCGNGLLVHILNSEGHNGIGLDVRDRKIWSYYPPTTILKVATITPSSNCIHPDADWIIGNHSDELTPWIPIMTSRSSYNCKFFLLPCCPYEFTGNRYQRRVSSTSLYQDHIQYIKYICNKIKFNFKVDKLRIPSTKRICLIGDSRHYSKSLYDSTLIEIQDFVINECNKKTQELQNSSDPGDKYKKITFIPRNNEEKVRNCTQIDKNIVSSIVKKVSDELIKNQKFVSENFRNDAWNIDYSISIKAFISILTPNELKELKNECGGLQTLLKNHRYIFLINNGRVMFRKPSEVSNQLIKKKPCWFYHNHPHSCPLLDNKCSFIH